MTKSLGRLQNPFVPPPTFTIAFAFFALFLLSAALSCHHMPPLPCIYPLYAYTFINVFGLYIYTTLTISFFKVQTYQIIKNEVEKKKEALQPLL